MLIRDFFARLVGSEKTGQHILIAITVTITMILIIVWGSGFDQEGKLLIIKWLLMACGILIIFGLGMAEAQQWLQLRAGLGTQPSRDPPVRPDDEWTEPTPGRD